MRTFKGKYGCIPGDCKKAANFGFPARGTFPAEGDGDGLLEGTYPGHVHAGQLQSTGETGLFWVDLSSAGFIPESFNTATATVFPVSNVTGADLAGYLPLARIGGGNYFYVYSDGVYAPPWQTSGINYFGLSTVTGIDTMGQMTSAANLSVAQAYAIDTKLDDGLPQSGSVIARYVNGGANTSWAGAAGTGPTARTSSTCNDNNSVMPLYNNIP